MKTSHFFLLLPVLLFTKIFAQSGSVEAIGRCPATCFPSIEDAFRECARFLTIGCVLTPCAAGGFGCPIPDPIETENEVLPGGEVLIDGLNVLDFFQFKVNLNTSFPLRTDLYLLSDATGSVSAAIGEIRTRFTEIVDLFEGETNAQFGIGFFRDEEDEGLDNGFSNLQGITSDRSAVTNAIQSLNAIDGGDADEANLVALHKVATDPAIGWRESTRRILVYFGDFPGHEPTCVEGKTLTRESVINDLQELNITVIAASFGLPGLDGTPDSFGCSSGSAGPGQGTAISSATGGILVPNTQQTELIEAIERAGRGLSRTFDLDSSDCDGMLTTSTDPSLPITLGPDESQVLDQIVQIQAGVCAGGNTFECVLDYTESGASLPPTTVKLVNIQGCPDFGF
ncbi:von Willebrand factor A-like protein [Gracilaria domingensis]|nr:von Willebrand factor A-like protein [Gracilaria domingensis]